MAHEDASGAIGGKVGLVNPPIIYMPFGLDAAYSSAWEKRGPELGSEDSGRGTPSADQDFAERSYTAKCSR